MSKATTVYDALVVLIQGLLPNHARLTNPYKIDENSELYLKQGWGVAIGSALNTERLLGCERTEERTYRIVISRKYFARELDAAGKATTEKLLMEDADLIKEQVEFQPTLTGLAPIVKWTTDTGIQYVSFNKDQFMYLEMDISIEYFQQQS